MRDGHVLKMEALMCVPEIFGEITIFISCDYVTLYVVKYHIVVCILLIIPRQIILILNI